jgi:3-oxoacyl-[acyl-carrier-protein] synthase I
MRPANTEGQLVYVTSVGMTCPVGLYAEAACAAMRASISMFADLPYGDNSGEAIIGSTVGRPAPEIRCEEHFVDLLCSAIKDCQTPAVPEDIPLLLGLPEPERPGIPKRLAERMIGRVQEELGFHFHPGLSQTICSGHTSGFVALRTARELLRHRKATACMVCGVDSFLSARSLLWLAEHGRLKTEENSDGVIPGEAAAAVLVGLTEASGATSSVRIAGMGFAHEHVNILSQEPLLGLGLSEALRDALAEAGIGLHEIDFRLSDVTGESYGFREQMLALARVMRSRREEGMPIWHCAEFIGDTGAAAGVCQLVVAFSAFKKGYAPGNRGACYTSAISGDRAVVIVEQRRP